MLRRVEGISFHLRLASCQCLSAVEDMGVIRSKPASVPDCHLQRTDLRWRCRIRDRY